MLTEWGSKYFILNINFEVRGGNVYFCKTQSVDSGSRQWFLVSVLCVLKLKEEGEMQSTLEAFGGTEAWGQWQDNNISTIFPSGFS